MDQGFASVAVGEHTTVFYRMTPSGREGFVVDELALVESLKERVLQERGLSELVDVTSASATDLQVGLFTHQFVAPFGGVTARLRLAPLDVPWFEQALIPLALCTALLLLVGLWALYQVVKTQLVFAQRQSNFVSAVTHELKTPLTAIRMHGEMLQEGLVDGAEKAQQYYSTITSQTERLTRLIDNVLLFSQVEKKAERTICGDVLPTVRRAAGTLEPHVRKSGFSLELELASRLVEVAFNPDHLEQILFNLVENALKYAASAQDRRLTLAVDHAPTEVVISVRDRGPGVPPELREKIFDPFYRAQDELTRQHQGSGLGLALVRRLAEQMGGSVSAEAARPGLRVSIFLPYSSTESNEGTA